MKVHAAAALVVLLAGTASPVHAETRTAPEATQHAIDENTNACAQRKPECWTPTPAPTATPRPTSIPVSVPTPTPVVVATDVPAQEVDQSPHCYIDQDGNQWLVVQNQIVFDIYGQPVPCILLADEPAAEDNVPIEAAPTTGPPPPPAPAPMPPPPPVVQVVQQPVYVPVYIVATTEPTEPPTPTSIPTSTSTPTVTPTPTSTATLIPTSTLVPTATPFVEPSPTPAVVDDTPVSEPVDAPSVTVLEVWIGLLGSSPVGIATQSIAGNISSAVYAWATMPRPADPGMPAPWCRTFCEFTNVGHQFKLDEPAQWWAHPPALPPDAPSALDIARYGEARG